MQWMSGFFFELALFLLDFSLKAGQILYWCHWIIEVWGRVCSSSCQFSTSDIWVKWRRRSRWYSSSMRSWRRQVRRLLSPHKWRQVHCEATASAPLIVNIFTFKSILLQHQFLASVTAIVAQEQELAEISGQLPTQLPWLRQLPPRLRRLPSPPPESGRRQVTTVARMDVPTFSTFNMDGPSSPPPSRPPPPGFSTLGLRLPLCHTDCYTTPLPGLWIMLLIVSFAVIVSKITNWLCIIV